MAKLSAALLVIGAFLVALPVASAYGYGTSSITLSQPVVNISAGGSASVGYTVNLASGSTWGTNLNVVNQAYLSSHGITASLSNAYAEPPFSGTLSIGVSQSTAYGTYSVILQASGDAPSASNATLTVNVPAPKTTKPASSNTTQNSTKPASSVTVTTANAVAVTAATTAGAGSSGYTSKPGTIPSSAQPGSGLLYGLIAVIVVIAAILMMLMKPMPTKLIIAGVALILIGVGVWLYGDYGGGLQYVWPGVAAILLGTLVWIAGDYIAGAFRRSK